jgi:hypothetical protein
MLRAQEVLQKLKELIYPIPPESPAVMLVGVISSPEGIEEKLY